MRGNSSHNPRAGAQIMSDEMMLRQNQSNAQVQYISAQQNNSNQQSHARQNSHQRANSQNVQNQTDVSRQQNLQQILANTNNNTNNG